MSTRPSETRPSILLVEDEPDTADLVKLIMEQEGYQVLHAADGQDALEKVASIPLPSLVLLDIQLPHVDGIAVLETIRAIPDWRDVPVVLMTAVVDPLCIRQAVSLKVQEYLIKPFKRDTLVRYVERALTPLERD
ncbi:MAG: response regulator [Nitrospira sp.]|nr:response regulator [Nitrospira sp.]MBX3334023.1 response regulator [Nitrospira sp.]MDR4465302.1 response regulator [Nitrospira sp.]MDR4467314.1 response regulator [Nitrospira sp.]